MNKENLNELFSSNMTFSEFLNLNLKIDVCFDSLDLAGKEKLSTIVIDYILENKYIFSIGLIEFLTTDKNNYIYNFEHFIKKTLNQVKNLNYIRKWYLCKKILCAHKRPYSRDNLYCEGLSGNISYRVDDETIDEALTYIKNNHFIDSLISMNFICKNIAKGNIIYKSVDKKSSLY